MESGEIMENSREDGIIIFDEYSVVRIRTTNLFHGYNIHVSEATNELELFNLMADKDLNIALIIMDIGYDVNKGFDILSRIKEKRYAVPVLILTANNKRQTFIRGIAEGASDYILKPFEDDYLLEKVLQILKKKKLKTKVQVNTNNEIVFDIHNYLNTELKKAQKGKYEISIFMITFFIPVDEVNAKNEKKYIQLSDLFYQTIKSVIWSTDILEQYGTQTFIGVFPFCGLDSTEKIQKKMMDSFDKLKAQNKEIDAFHLAISSVTYPSEQEDAKELLLTLGTRMNQEIEEVNKTD